MYSLTAFDLWLTTDPREADDAAWEEYADRYHDRARQVVVDHLTDTVPTADVNPTDRACLLAALARVVSEQDTEMVTAWARELSDEIPGFEDWCVAQRGRAA